MTARVAVLGAGVSGLAAAHRLLELARERGAALDVKVFEASARAGGAAETVRRDGFLLENGPDSFITDKPAALALCRRLGLERDLIGVSPRFRRSFVARGGRLHPTPEGFYLLAPGRLLPFLASPLLSWSGKLRAAGELFVPRGDGGDESLASFVRRRFGGEALEALAQPMIAGVYAADPETLSLRATFPRFLDMEAEHRSLILALRRRSRSPGLRAASGPRYGLFATLRSGVGALTEALLARLPAGALRLNAAATSLSRTGDAWKATFAGGAAETFDGVCLALPGGPAAALLAPLDAAAADVFRRVPYGSAAVAHFAYARAQVSHALDGIGFVVPAREKSALLGCTFSHAKFEGRAPEGKVLLRAFADGRAPLDDAALSSRLESELGGYLGITGAPLFATLRRHPASLPHYVLGHLERAAAAEAALERLPGLAVAGNALRGIGLPDVVRSGEEAAEKIFDRVSGRRAAA